MPDLEEIKYTKQEKTLLTSILLSSPGPIVTAIAVLKSNSATQMADFLRRTSELVALVISGIVYGKIKKNAENSDEYISKLEKISSMAVVFSMLCSGFVMFLMGVYRLFVRTIEDGNVGFGLLIAFLGFTTNTWFFIKYGKLLKEKHEEVIASQHKLYAGKSAVDFVVCIALFFVFIAPHHWLTIYIDAGGCIIVSMYLFYSGIKNIKKKVK